MATKTATARLRTRQAVPLGSNCPNCPICLSSSGGAGMKILFVTGSLPYPPQQGGALRTYGLLNGLHLAGHDLTLLSFTDVNNANYAGTPLETFCTLIKTVDTPNRSRQDRLRDLFLSREPDIARRLYSAEFETQLKELIRTNPFDLIQFEGIEVACYLPIVRQMKTPAKLIYDAFNAEAAMQHEIGRAHV